MEQEQSQSQSLKNVTPLISDLNFQATCTVIWNCMKMKMILLFCYDAARRYSVANWYIYIRIYIPNLKNLV